jgi:hypothetical protein
MLYRVQINVRIAGLALSHVPEHRRKPIWFGLMRMINNNLNPFTQGRVGAILGTRTHKTSSPLRRVVPMWIYIQIGHNSVALLLPFVVRDPLVRHL